MTNKIKHVTQERLKELFTLTSEGLFWKTNRPGVVVGRGASLHKSSGYKVLKVDYRQYREHRLIWLFVYGSLPKTLDHIDGNKLNNRIQNLRKDNGFDVVDKIGIKILTNEQINAAINNNKKYICDETLASSLEVVNEVNAALSHEVKFEEGINTYISIEKLN